MTVKELPDNILDQQVCTTFQYMEVSCVSRKTSVSLKSNAYQNALFETDPVGVDQAKNM